MFLATALVFSEAQAQSRSSCQILEQQMNILIEEHVANEEQQLLFLLKDIVPELDQTKFNQLKTDLELSSKKFSPSLSLEDEKALENLQLRAKAFAATPTITELQWYDSVDSSHENPQRWRNIGARMDAIKIAKLAGGVLHEKEKELLKSLTEKQKKHSEYSVEVARAEAALDEFFTLSIHKHLKTIDRASPGDKFGKVFVNGEEYLYDRKGFIKENFLLGKDAQGKEQQITFRLLGDEVSVSKFPQNQIVELNQTLMKLANDSRSRRPINDVWLGSKGIKNLAQKSSEVKYSFIGTEKVNLKTSVMMNFDEVKRNELIKKFLPQNCKEKLVEKSEHISDTDRDNIKIPKEDGFFKGLFGGDKESTKQ